MSFHERKEHELDLLEDEDLIAYLVAAREAGAIETARTALGIFAHRRFDVLVARAMLKMGNRGDAEEVVAEVMFNALQASFKGTSPGEAMNLLYRALAFRIADYYSASEGRDETPLPELLGEEERKGPPVGFEQDETGAVEVQRIVDTVLSRLDPRHQAVVHLRIFGKYSSKETAEMVNDGFPDEKPPMTDSNCDQIVRRFRKDLKGELNEGS